MVIGISMMVALLLILVWPVAVLHGWIDFKGINKKKKV